jgi:transcriptional regulator with XRE-family HTH domain
LQPLDAERVKEWRHRRMLSQQEVADRAGTSLFTVQRIERGEGNVRPKTGRGVAAALDIPIEELLPKAQAPLFRELPEHNLPEERREDGRAAVRAAIEDLRLTAERFERYHTAQEKLDEFREGWEKRLAEEDFDKVAIEEASRTIRGFWSAVTALADSEMVELMQYGYQLEEAAAKSALVPAITRFQALAEKVNTIYSERFRDAPAQNVIWLTQRKAS